MRTDATPAPALTLGKTGNNQKIGKTSVIIRTAGIKSDDFTDTLAETKKDVV